MKPLTDKQINDAFDLVYGKEKVSDARKPQYEQDNDDENKELQVNYSFEIKEDFSTLRENLLKSMKNDIIRALAHDEREILTDEYMEIPVYDENNNKIDKREAQVLACGYEENDGWKTQGYRKGIEVEKDAITLYSIDDNEWDYLRNSVSIRPSEKGGCIVDGDVHLLTDSERSIFTGVRKEMTYVPDTYMSFKEENGYRYQKTYLDDTILRNQEEHKISWQSFKNDLGNESFGRTPEDFEASKLAQINAVLKYIDPDKDKPMEGPHVGVTYHHHIHNYGTDFENEYIDIQDDYPSECLHGVYDHNGTRSDWGRGASVPAHWNEKQTQQYLELRIIDRYDISEKLFDGYLKSKEPNLVKYLKGKHKKAIETHKNIEQAKQRIEKNKKLTSEIRTGMEKSTPIRNVSADAPFKTVPTKHGKDMGE